MMPRNALIDLAENAERFTFLVRDQGPQFTGGFDAVLHAADIRIVTAGTQGRVMDAIRERQYRSVRTEPLDRTQVCNRIQLRRARAEHDPFYNSHRPHRALGQPAPPRPVPDNATALDVVRACVRARRQDRIGGIIRARHVAT